MNERISLFYLHLSLELKLHEQACGFGIREFRKSKKLLNFSNAHFLEKKDGPSPP
jgi:hypothetical protein